jgi:hypothetical protein
MVSLLIAYKKFRPGMKVMSPFTTLCVLIDAVYCVDDGMPGVNNSNTVQPQLQQQLVAAAESSAQSWERLLFVSGGEDWNSPTQCFTYMMRWNFDAGQHPPLLLPPKIEGCVPLDPSGEDADAWQGPIGQAPLA